ncbi:unnamed protein product [Rotaria sp. Silwood2]|nr:unnamed protein product [Rotaria sp. Silwood2]
MTTSNELYQFMQVDWTNRKKLSIDGLKTSGSDPNIIQALHTASNRFRNVEAYVKQAEEYLNGIELDELTFDERVVVYAYTRGIGRDSLHTLLNQALCTSDKKASDLWLPFLRLFYSAAAKLPNFQGKCWRIGNNNILQQIKSRHDVIWSGASSTDPKPDVDQASHSTEPTDNNNTARSSSNPKHDADPAYNSKKTTRTDNTIKPSPKSNHDDYQNSARANPGMLMPLPKY